MTKMPGDIRNLLWAEEGLDEAERARLAAYLEAHPEARELRERVRTREAAARESPSIPPLEDPVYGLSGEEARQERVSYHALMRRLREPETARAGRRPGAWLRWLIPVAAAAGIALIWFGDFGGGAGVSDLAVLRVDREGLMRSVEEGGVWRSGDAFALEAHFVAGVVPFVFLVDPAGVPSMLHPPPGRATTPTARAGILRFPTPESGDLWILGPDAGPETFLVAAGRADPPVPAELAARVGSLAGDDRAAVLAEVKDLLETAVGPVAVIEIDHRL
jgi:hypothetical protein